MQFCIRREIDFVNSEERLRRVGRVPIEIALPLRIEDFFDDQRPLINIKRQLEAFEVPVYSVHAPHGRLADESFRTWAGRVIGFAESVGAGIAVFHPEKRPGESPQESKSEAILNLKYVQDRTRVVVAVATFWDDNPILSPDDIMEHHLPMVLDTSLMPKSEITWIMESYHTHVVNVHLSAVTPPGKGHAAIRHYRPVDNDPFCLDILDRFHEIGWDGLVTLKYMPWLSNKSMEDRVLLERIYRQYQLEA